MATKYKFGMIEKHQEDSQEKAVHVLNFGKN